MQKHLLIIIAMVLLSANRNYAENLMLNPSFEVGTYGWTWGATTLSIYPESTVHVAMDRETPTAGPALGTASLKITADQGVFSPRLVSVMAAINPAGNYTFSFYAKASNPLEIKAWGFAPATETVTLIGQTFKVGKEWQRFSAGFDAKVLEGKKGVAGIYTQMENASVFKVSIGMPYNMTGAIVWLDGMQLAPGELGEYDDGRPIMAGPESAKYDNTYEPEEKIAPVFYFYRKSAEDKTLYQARWHTEECLTGNTIGELTVPVQFEPGKRTCTQGFPYPVTSSRPGTFKTTVTLMADNKELDYTEYIHAVYKPLPVPADFDDSSLFAVDNLWQSAPGRASWDWYFKKASEMGTRTYREWQRIDDHPAKGKYRWDSVGGKNVYGREELWKLSDKYKIRPMCLIGPYCYGAHYLPAWIFTDKVTKSPKCYEGHDPEKGKLLPKCRTGQSHDARLLNLEALGDYCYELAKHFKDRYKCYEIFNECSWFYEYPDYLKVCYEAIKKADPGAMVLPNVSPTPEAADIIRLKETGALAKYCDGISHHVGFNDPSTIPEYQGWYKFPNDWKEFWKNLTGKKEPIVWDTEGRAFGQPYYTHMQPDQRGKNTRQDQVNQAMRSQRLWIMLHDIGYGKWFYFTFAHNDASYDGDTANRLSLLEFNDTPRLAYISTGNAARLLTGSKSLGRIKLASDQLWCYQFKMKNGERFVTLWNADEKPAEFVVDIPISDIRAEDMLGNPFELKGKGNKTVIPISGAPVYIFGKNKGGIWSDANKVADVFAKGEATGLNSIQIAVQLAQNPENGKPALVVMAKNIGLREFNGVFQTVAGPWDTKGDRVGISGLAPGETGTGYLDYENVTLLDNEIILKAFYQYGNDKIEASRNIPKVAFIAKKKDAITIDGRIDDVAWGKAGNGFAINSKEQVAYEREEGTLKEIYNGCIPGSLKYWKGSDDFSSIHKVLWDENALYIGSRVKTRYFVQTRTNPDRIYDSTCIELFFSLDPLANAWPNQGENQKKQSDYQLLFAPATPENPQYVTLAHRGIKNEKFRLEGLEVKSRPVEGGYEMEIKLPWKNFPEITGQAKTGKMIGMDISVDSPFADGNRQWQMAWTGDGNNCGLPDNYARVILSDEIPLEVRKEEYTPVKPFTERGVNVTCDKPGVYYIKWHYKTERPESLWNKFNFEEIGGLGFAGGPLGVGTDPNEGIVRVNTAYGFANCWTEGLYYFTVLKPGTYNFGIGISGAPGVENVLIDNVTTGRAMAEDFKRDNLLVDGSFESGCADFHATYPMLKARKDGRWDWSYALDTQEFCDGKQSLRMTSTKGGVEIYSRPLPVITGKKYRLEAMVKQADDKTNVRLFMDLWPCEPGQLYSEWRRGIDYWSAELTLNDNKWHLFSTTIEVKKWKENKPTTGVLRIFSQTPGTYWVDNVNVYLVEDKATDETQSKGISERLTVGKRGKAGEYPYALANNTDKALTAASNDVEDYVIGKSSLRLENRAPTVPKESGVDIPIPNALIKAVFLNLRSTPFELSAGKTYTLSFWARCNVLQSGNFGNSSGQLSVWQAIEPQGYQTKRITDQFYNGRQWPYEQVVNVTDEWKKYTLKFTVPADAQGPFTHLIRFTDKANLWIDGITIQEKK